MYISFYKLSIYDVAYIHFMNQKRITGEQNVCDI